MDNIRYNILAINPGHNGSAAFLSNGELIFYAEEERYSRAKYDGNPFRVMLQVLLSNGVDELVIGGTNPQLPTLPWTGEDPYSAFVRKFNSNVKITNLGNFHHLGHAASAFYNSGFNSAVSIVVDGAGSLYQEKVGEKNNTVTLSGFETESIYHCGYPHEFNIVYKRFSDGSFTNHKTGKLEFDGSVTITKAYEAVSAYLGFGFIEAGKTMGLAPYGVDDPNIPSFFISGKGNRNLLIPNYPAGAFINENNFSNLKRFMDPIEWHRDFNLVTDVDKNLAFKVQKETEEMMYALINHAIESTGENKVVISGGYGLNCVANYKYLKKFPGIEFYIDPIAHDGGTAIGLAKYAWYQHSKSMDSKPLNSVYLGAPPDYNQLQLIEQQIENIEIIDTTPDDVVDLIINRKIIALFQGKSEGGPRALGNRSLLFDPRANDGKDIVNGVKMREWFRPFAGSVLEEEANKWFDMAGLKSSPFMMYAVNVLNEKVDIIPAVCHVDNTCRVQTVNKQDNPQYYELINIFYKKTGVPLLMNTSLNLAGQPLVESLVDAVVTLINSKIDYLYFADIGKLVSMKR